MKYGYSVIGKCLNVLTMLCVFTASYAIPLPVEMVDQLLDRQLPFKASNLATNVTNPSLPISEIEQQLSDSKVSLNDKVRLLNQLGEAKTPGTEKLIIQFAETLRAEEAKPKSIKLKSTYFFVFKLLLVYDDPSTAIDYANRLLRDKAVDPVVHARAMYFLGDLKDPEAKQWSEQYYRNTTDLDEQYASLYLGSKLGLEPMTQAAIEFLNNLPKSDKSYKHETHLLLESLVQTQSAETLEGIIKTIKANNAQFLTDKKINAYPHLAKLSNGDTAQRKMAALNLIKGWQNNRNEIITSLNHLISNNDPTPYVDLWRLHHPVFIRIIQNIGYQIDLTTSPASFKPITTTFDPSIPTPDRLIETLLQALKRGEIDQSLLINKDQASLFSSYNDPGAKPEKLYDQTHQAAIESWQKIYEKMANQGLSGAELEYQSHQSEVFVTRFYQYFTNLTIQLKGEGKTHPGLLISCVLIDNDWHILSGMRWL